MKHSRYLCFKLPYRTIKYINWKIQISQIETKTEICLLRFCIHLTMSQRRKIAKCWHSHFIISESRESKLRNAVHCRAWKIQSYECAELTEVKSNGRIKTVKRNGFFLIVSRSLKLVYGQSQANFTTVCSYQAFLFKVKEQGVRNKWMFPVFMD